jgi:hypothetical protein
VVASRGNALSKCIVMSQEQQTQFLSNAGQQAAVQKLAKAAQKQTAASEKEEAKEKAKRLAEEEAKLKAANRAEVRKNKALAVAKAKHGRRRKKNGNARGWRH